MGDLIPQAIEAALSSDWDKAIELNTKILAENCEDIDCLNRLGKAYLEQGNYKKAATIFRKVLKINRYDQIAARNLARATQQPGSTKKPCGKINPAVNFLEEPGRTKLIQLINLASGKVLLKLNQADQITLCTKRRTIVALDDNGNYLGALPDDVGHRLAMLIKGGNTYVAFIKSVTKNSLIIFVRETHRAKRFADTASFMNTTNDYFSFIREEPTNVAGGEEEVEDEHPMSRQLHDDEEA